MPAVAAVVPTSASPQALTQVAASIRRKCRISFLSIELTGRKYWDTLTIAVHSNG